MTDSRTLESEKKKKIKKNSSCITQGGKQFFLLMKNRPVLFSLTPAT